MNEQKELIEQIQYSPEERRIIFPRELKRIERIRNVNDFLNLCRAKARHLLCSGTFDPMHDGHIKLIKAALDLENDNGEIIVCEDNPLLLIPHNRTKGKSPADFDFRVDLIEADLLEVLLEARGKILILTEGFVDEGDEEKWQRFKSDHNSKLYRIAGSDKEGLCPIIDKLVPRDDISSTIIREALQNMDFNKVRGMTPAIGFKILMQMHNAGHLPYTQKQVNNAKPSIHVF